MASEQAAGSNSPWELAAETIAVKIRWFGLVIAYVLVNAGGVGSPNREILNAILALGVGYALLDTYYSVHGRVFLHRYPLLISLMEAFFIGLLCFFHDGLESPFRYYYLLSLICCAIRHSQRITFATCALHCASVTVLYFALPYTKGELLTFLLMLVILVWVTWASDAMAYLLKRLGEHLTKLNDNLRENQVQLEERINERTSQLQQAQALLLHQEKMANFGLLAAGIAHEVGNPLTAINSLVQILQRRELDDYTHEKLGLVNGELKRIQTTLRELVDFGRPVTSERTMVTINAAIEEALSIVKYYKRTKQRRIETEIAPDLPPLFAARDTLVQIILNLVLNAIDATEKGGRIRIVAEQDNHHLSIRIHDDGCGISKEQLHKIFDPYFTTKRNGTGLGLFVTQKLIADLRGTITCESNLGEGTTFFVTLPFAFAVRGSLGKHSTESVTKNRLVSVGSDDQDTG